MSQPAVTYTLKERVAELRMDDGKVNAISPGILVSLNAALDRAQEEAQSVLLIGRPGCFSAGFDLKVMGQGTEPARDLLHAGGDFLLRLMEFPLPVVAGCTGHALALGALMLLSSDHRVGSAGPFKLGLNEVAIGMALPRFGVALAQERLAPPHRLRVALLSDPSDPDRAAGAGLLDEVVSADSIETEAYARAARLAELPRPAFETTKQRLRGEWAARARTGLAQDIEDFGA